MEKKIATIQFFGTLTSEFRNDNGLEKGFSVQLEVKKVRVNKENQLSTIILCQKTVELEGDGKLHNLEAILRKWNNEYNDFFLAYNDLNQNFQQHLAIEIDEEEYTNGNIDEAKKRLDQAIKNLSSASQALIQTFNEFLDLSKFSEIISILDNEFDPKSSNHILIQIDKEENLRRLPWSEWKFLQKYSATTISLASANFKAIKREKPDGEKELKGEKKLKILPILGDEINENQDANLLNELQSNDKYKGTVKVEPACKTQEEIEQFLEKDRCDILLYFGHGGHNQDEQTGTIRINGQEVDIANFRKPLKEAIKKGLKLVILNCCDGLGLAYQLAEGGDLHCPNVIAMHNKLPKEIAPHFLNHFFSAYTEGKSLPTSIKEAKEKLKEWEKYYPGASWLPILCQNPTEIPPRWVELGGKPLKEPYKGLEAFQESDRDIFFGRQRFVDCLLEQLQKQYCVPIVGTSGSGKSSVVRAGLIPQWRDRAPENTRKAVCFRPGEKVRTLDEQEKVLGKDESKLLGDPCLSLAKVIVPLCYSNNEMEPQLKSLDMGIHFEKEQDAIVKALESPDRNFSELLVVIDQFEEVFTRCSEKRRKAFLAGLSYAVSNCPPYCRFILTIRDDYLGIALDDENIGSILQEYSTQSLAGRMSDSELRNVILKPIEPFDMMFEKGLVDKIIHDFGQPSALENDSKSVGHLPMLQLLLTELWKKQCGGFLTHAAYKEMGGIEQVLTEKANDIYTTLSQEDKKRTERIFKKLVAGNPPVSKRATEEEIDSENWDLVTQFVDARLLVTSTIESSSDNDTCINIRTVEVMHEILFKKWTKFREWIEEDKNFRFWQEQLRERMRQWKQKKRDRGALLRGGQLKDAEEWLEWLDKQRRPITSDEKTFIYKSKAQQKWLDSIVAMIIVSLIGLTGWAFAERAQKESQRVVAEQQRIDAQLIAYSLSSENLVSSNQELEGLMEAIRAGKLVQEAQKVNDPTRNRVVIALQRALYNNIRERNRLEFDSDDGLLSRDDLQFNSDGNRIYAWKGNTIKSWSPDGRLIKSVNISHPEQSFSYTPVSVTISQDGKHIAVGMAFNPPLNSSYDDELDDFHNIIIYDFQGEILKTFKGHQDNIHEISFSPDGQMVASASSDKTVKLWSWDNGRLIKTFKHDEPVRDVSFSPDGKMLATAGQGKVVRLWSIDGEELQRYEGHESWIDRVEFSPDGQRIASFSPPTGTLRLWSLDGKEIKSMKGHTGSLLGSFDFSPNGQFIVTTGDKNIKLWNQDGTLFDTIKSNMTQGSVAFSPDGKMIAIAGLDDTVRLWNLELIQPKMIPSGADKISYSSDGKRIALTPIANSGKAQIWDIKEKTLLKSFKESDQEINDVQFIPSDSEAIVSVNSSNINFWNLEGQLQKKIDATVQIVQRYQGHTSPRTKIAPVTGVTFSPDGKLIASVGFDEYIRLWSPNGLTGTLVGEFLSNKSNKQSVRLNPTFSPDGQFTALSDDNKIKLWKNNFDKKISNQALEVSPKVLEKHKERVLSIDFSSNSQFFVSASLDQVNLWENDGTLIKTLKHEHGNTRDAQFSPDGKNIATAADGVYIWSSSGELLKRFGNQTTQNLSLEYTSLDYSPDGEMIVTSDMENTVKLWDSNGKALATIGEHEDYIRKVIFSPDGKLIASASYDGTIQLWRRNGTLVKTIEAHDEEVLDINFSPDSKMLVSAGSDGLLKLWNKDGSLLKIVLGETFTINTTSPNHVSLSADGKLFALANGFSVQLWSREGKLVKNLSGNGVYILGDGSSNGSGKVVKHYTNSESPKGRVDSISISPDGNLIVLSFGETIGLWNTKSGLFKTLEGHGDPINEVTLSPDGSYIASASVDGTVRLWDKEGNELKVLRGHNNSVVSVSFSPDGNLIASGSWDDTIKLWDLDGTLLRTLNIGDMVYSVRFSPDGKTLAVSTSEQVSFWDFNLDSLLVRSCEQIQDYLEHNSKLNESDRNLCDGIGSN